MVTLSREDIEIVYELVESLIGADQSEGAGYGNFVRNILGRMHTLGLNDLGSYLAFVRQNNDEFDELIHCLTLHTTRWFCEHGQFEDLRLYIEEHIQKGEWDQRKLRLWSAACSSGEEAYSAAMVLEELRAHYPQFDYEVLATDIDPISVELARKAVFPMGQLADIPEVYRKHAEVRETQHSHFFVPSPTIMARVTCEVYSLLKKPEPGDFFDIILCRNVLRDFVVEKVRKIVKAMAMNLQAKGILVLGPHERLFDQEIDFTPIGKSFYRLGEAKANARGQLQITQLRRTAVLLVDDEADFRDLASDILSAGNMVCYSVASIPHALAELAVREIDLVLCDISMPGINGFEGVSQLRGYGFEGPIVILSTYDRETVVENFSRLGTQAQEYIEKQNFVKQPEHIAEVLQTIAAKYNKHLSQKISS